MVMIAIVVVAEVMVVVVEAILVVAGHSGCFLSHDWMKSC